MSKKIKKESLLNNSKSTSFSFEDDKKNKNKFFGLILFLIIFLIASLSIIFLINSSLEELKKDYSEYVLLSSNKIDSLNKLVLDLTIKKNDLNKSLNIITLEYNSLFDKANELESSYFDLKEEVNETLLKIDDYELQIQNSLEWFSYNSKLGANSSRIISNLKASCKKESTKICQINLGCFHLVNYEFINYKYKDDLVTSNTIDKLQSIEEFIKNKGGDCEDFSLFFKAEYNSLIEYCSNKPIELFAWVDEKNSRFWANFDETWYLSNAKKKYLNESNVFPSVVCGAMFDPNTQSINGHCVIAFTSKRINLIEDIDSLNHAELVEPQSGKYLGFVGEDSGIHLTSQNNSSSSYINTIITDKDFFIYKNKEWVNYEGFGVDLENQKQKLVELVKE
jgi:hypothetical protein